MTTSARAMHSRQQIPNPPQRDGLFFLVLVHSPPPAAVISAVSRLLGPWWSLPLPCVRVRSRGRRPSPPWPCRPPHPNGLPGEWGKWGEWGRPALRADATLRPRVTYALQQFPVLRDAAAKGLDSAGAAANTCPKLPHCNDCDGRGWQASLGPLVSFYCYCSAGSRRSDRRLPSKVRILSNISKFSGLLLVFCLII
jgi:hypothetical protein